MLGVLIKKQLNEIFRAYFIDRRTGKARSSASTIALFIFYAFILLFVSGSFAMIAYAICPVFYDEGISWLYFAFFTTIAVVFGTFASVFNSYSGLYLSKDNDLLLSMPIPVGIIMASRLFGVYIMGLLYSSVIMLPTIVIYFIVAPITFSAVLGCLLHWFFVSLFVLILSCALGYVVARISVKLKNKSYITVIVSIVALAAYMALVYSFNGVIEGLIENAAVYGEAVLNSFYPAYIIGSVSVGDYISMLIEGGVVLALFALTFFIIARSFIKVVTATGNVSAAKKAVSPQKTRGVFGALFQKELSRFLGSATYMLNSGLGALMTVILGFVLIFYGPTLSTLLSENLGDPSLVFILAIAAICVTASTVDTVVPSVSLEGKTLWQIKCLPIKAETVLLAKFSLQFVIAAVPALFASVCAIIALGADIVQAVFLIVVPIVFIVLNDLFGLILALKMPNLNWTSEIVPIKQGLNVAIALFGGWILSIALFAPYFLLGSVLGFAVYLAIVSAILIIISVLLFAYLKKRGGAILSEL